MQLDEETEKQSYMVTATEKNTIPYTLFIYTLVYRINAQYDISTQGKKFFKNNKHTGY